MTPEEVAKVRQLLTHEDPDIQRQGLELAKSFGDYSAVFEGWSMGEQVNAAIKLRQSPNDVASVTITLGRNCYQEAVFSSGTWADSGELQPDLPPETSYIIRANRYYESAQCCLHPPRPPDIEQLAEVLTTTPLDKISSKDLDFDWDLEDESNDVISAEFEPEIPQVLEDKIDLKNLFWAGEHDVDTPDDGEYFNGIWNIEIGFTDGDDIILY